MAKWTLCSSDDIPDFLLDKHNIVSVPQPAGSDRCFYVGSYRGIMACASWLRFAARDRGRIFTQRYYSDKARQIDAIDYRQHYRDGVYTIAWIERSGA